MNDAHINPAVEGKEKKAFKYNFTPTSNDSLQSHALCKQQGTDDDDNLPEEGDDKTNNS